jgi:hypothetical protein
MFHKISQLTLTPGKKAASLGEVFIAQPDTTKENLAGKLFVLVETDSRETDYLKFINLLVSEMNRNYYQNEKMILRERVSTIKIDHIFESALAKTNKQLAAFFQNDAPFLKIDRLSATVGIIYENDLYFSLIGKNKAYLIYREKNAPGNPVYKIAEVSQGGDANPLNPNKLFSSVTSGVVPEKGYFIFSNETLPEYLSTKQLLEIITTLPPGSAMEQLKNIFSSVNSFANFLAITIKNTVGTPASEDTARPASTGSSSVVDLVTTEEATEKLLTPSGLFDIRKWLGLSPRGNALPKSTGARFSPGLFPLKDRLFFKKRSPLKLLSVAASYLKNFFSSFLIFIVGLTKLLTDRKRLSALPSQAAGSTAFHFKSIIGWFKRLSRKNKILFAASLLLIFLFLNNSWLLDRQNKKQVAIQYNFELYNSIEQKENQVEASLIYNDQIGARAALKEIRSMLDQMPNETPAEKDKLAILVAKYEQQLEKTRRVVKIEKLNETADLSKSYAAATPDRFFLDKNRLFVIDSAQKAIYRFDQSKKTWTVFNDFASSTVGLNFAISAGTNIYFLNDGSILKFDETTAKTENIAVNLVGGGAGTAALAVYNNRLYLADKQLGEITKHERVGAAFGAGSSWLKTKTDLSKITDMFIDGRIYILSMDGSVSRYMKGVKEEFSIDRDIEPSMTDIRRLKVTNAGGYVYMLDPANNRLLVYDKNGKFVEQYQDERLAGAKDFMLSEADKKIYILVGTRIIEFTGQRF